MKGFLNTHKYSYWYVAFHKLSSIKLFNKNTDAASISAVFNKLIADLREYELAGRTTKVLDERTCLTIINYVISPFTELCPHIKICERVKNKVIEFTL